jgi:arylsulfatase A-like enzyme
LEGNQKYGGLAYHAVRRGDWKLLRNTPFEPYQMFNLANDPGEETPVARQKAPKKYNELFESLMRHINLAGKVSWQRAEEGRNTE